MLMSVLSILGVVQDFVKDNWKLIVPLILVALAYNYHKNAVEDSFEAGVESERTANAAAIAELNDANRKFEQMLDDSISSFGERIANEAAVRTAAEIESKETIRTIIQNNPVYEQCVVDDAVIEELNNIRAKGPGN